MKNISVSIEAELIDVMKQFNVPIEKYGTQGVKRMSDLFKEIVEGGCQLVVDDCNLIRLVKVARVSVRYLGIHLVEDRQVFKDGRGERKRNNEGLSEKFEPNESPREVAEMALLEELGISKVQELVGCGDSKEEKNSPSCSGLLSRYVFYDFVAHLDFSSFRKDGYEEDQEDKITYFIWVKNPCEV